MSNTPQEPDIGRARRKAALPIALIFVAIAGVRLVHGGGWVLPLVTVVATLIFVAIGFVVAGVLAASRRRRQLAAGQPLTWSAGLEGMSQNGQVVTNAFGASGKLAFDGSVVMWTPGKLAGGKAAQVVFGPDWHVSAGPTKFGHNKAIFSRDGVRYQFSVSFGSDFLPNNWAAI